MQTVETWQLIPQEIIDAAIAVFNVPSDYRTYIDRNLSVGSIIYLWKDYPDQIVVTDASLRSRPPEAQNFRSRLKRIKGFSNPESYADVVYCKNTNTLVFGSFSLVDD